MLLSILVTLIVVGLLLWLVNFLPLDATIKQIIHGVVIVAVILWLLVTFLPMVHLGAVHLR